MTRTNSWRSWLTKRPIAHRGLHGAKTGAAENSIEAAEAAIARNFAIECDVQLSKDGQPIVFHDFELDRLTSGTGKLIDKTAAEICAQPYKSAPGHPVTLEQFLDVIGDRTPLIIELKSNFSGDVRLAASLSQIVAASSTPIALKSFDPTLMAYLRQNQGSFGLGNVPLGMVAEARYDNPEWSSLDSDTRMGLVNFLHWKYTKPDFLSWHIGDFPHPTPNLLRSVLNLPIMTWTVRTYEQRMTARAWANQVIFEEDDGLRLP